MFATTFLQYLEDPKVWIMLFTLIISIAVAVYQIKGTIKGQTYQRVYEQMIGIDRFFFDNPCYKPYFYQGERKASIDPVQLASVAEMMADYFDMVFHQRSTMPAKTFEGFEEFMRSVYQYSDELKRHVCDNRDWYPEDFLASLEKHPRRQNAARRQ